MLRPPEMREGRPRTGPATSENFNRASSLAETSDVSPLAYVVIVSTSDDKIRRRPYLSLHSAEKAVERAEARGHVAALHLCRLVPVLAPVDGEA